MRAEMHIVAILPNVEYNKLPLGHLHQLDSVGISNVVILLNDEEFKKAHTTRFVLFDDTKPRTVIEHYQTQSDRLKIEVINTGTATTEEEKRDFYMNHAKRQYKLNLFLCKESMPGVTEELSAKPAFTETTEYSFVPFFKSVARQRWPLFQSPCSSEQAIKLLQHELNPCLCYKMATFDVLHYQWLFNIFVELINLEIKMDGGKGIESTLELSRLIKAFNENIKDLEHAEKSFDETHKKAYETLEETDVITRWRHKSNVSNRSNLEDNFPKLIGEFIALYDKVAAQENLHNAVKERSEVGIDEDYAHGRTDFKPFSGSV